MRNALLVVNDSLTFSTSLIFYTSFHISFLQLRHDTSTNSHLLGIGCSMGEW